MTNTPPFRIAGLQTEIDALRAEGARECERAGERERATLTDTIATLKDTIAEQQEELEELRARARRNARGEGGEGEEGGDGAGDDVVLSSSMCLSGCGDDASVFQSPEELIERWAALNPKA